MNLLIGALVAMAFVTINCAEVDDLKETISIACECIEANIVQAKADELYPFLRKMNADLGEMDAIASNDKMKLLIVLKEVLDDIQHISDAAKSILDGPSLEDLELCVSELTNALVFD